MNIFSAPPSLSSPSCPTIPIVIGPTASGKTLLAHHLARRLGGEVMNADSMQVYQDLACLSAQPDADFCGDVPYHLFGYKTVTQPYSAGHWYRDVLALLQAFKAEQRQAVLVGGTGMYIKVLLQGLIDCPPAPEDLRALIRQTMDDFSPRLYHALLAQYAPDLVARIDPNDRLRLLRAAEVWIMTGCTPNVLRETQNSGSVDHHFRIILIMPDRTELYPRINARFLQMIEEGAAISEVQALLNHTLTPHHPAMKMIGVPEIAAFLAGDLSRPRMLELGMQASRRYAKRQMTWLRHQIVPDVVIPFCVTEDRLAEALAVV